MTDTNIKENKRSEALALRLERGAGELVALAEGLSETDWSRSLPGGRRKVGVIIHHVASVYPVEIELAQMLGAGNPITEATNKVIDEMNASHASEFHSVGKEETIRLLKQNSKIAADAVRSFTDEELDSSGTVSLNSDAPLTAQFFIEDHALRHSYHHLAQLREALNG